MIVLLIAAVMIPILNPPDCPAPIQIPVAIIGGAALVIVGGLALVGQLIDNDNTDPCDNCRGLVAQPAETHLEKCGGCSAEFFTGCPAEKAQENPHIKKCEHCGETYYDCPTPLPEKDVSRANDHEMVDCDCGIEGHQYPECKPEQNHKNTTCDDCGTRHFECADCPPPQGSRPPIIEDDESGSEGSEGIIENNYDSSGNCDDSSGCCDDIS